MFIGRTATAPWAIPSSVLVWILPPAPAETCSANTGQCSTARSITAPGRPPGTECGRKAAKLNEHAQKMPLAAFRRAHLKEKQ